MTILTVNTGSSSSRLAAFTRDGHTLTQLADTRYDLSGREPRIILKEFLQAHQLAEIQITVHRVVHGGINLAASCLIDQEVEQEIGHVSTLAPLHNPSALRWIREARGVLGVDSAQVAVFDTAFFIALPEPARSYAIPHELVKKHGLRRYGFHGLAHQAMWHAWREASPNSSGDGRIISLQLGAGCSITATNSGLPLDTSMGFSPLEGLMMATRSGDVDPGLVTFLQRQENLTPEQADELLNERSGLLGASGISGDMRELLQSRDGHARLAVDLYCYRARKYLGAYLAVLGGAEAIVFGGGVGENVPAIREKILAGMQWCGIEIDAGKNLDPVGASRISSPKSRVEVWVIPVNEAAILAREGAAVMDKMSGGWST
ncbi:MAG: acetate/propionate family kinase [Nitrosospira sp.]|nr:acetate/propionate family kinase [Nitrosospira sp.]